MVDLERVLGKYPDVRSYFYSQMKGRGIMLPQRLPEELAVDPTNDLLSTASNFEKFAKITDVTLFEVSAQFVSNVLRNYIHGDVLTEDLPKLPGRPSRRIHITYQPAEGVIGETLRELRLHKSRRQAAVARGAGISPSMVQRIERGNRLPAIDTLKSFLFEGCGYSPVDPEVLYIGMKLFEPDKNWTLEKARVANDNLQQYILTLNEQGIALTQEMFLFQIMRNRKINIEDVAKMVGLKVETIMRSEEGSPYMRIKDMQQVIDTIGMTSSQKGLYWSLLMQE